MAQKSRRPDRPRDTESSSKTNGPPAQSWVDRWKVGLIIPAIVYGLAIIGFGCGRYSFLDFPLDDAWIHRVYSRSFAFGQGFAYNEGKQESGATSPFWVIVTAPTHWLERWGTDCVVVAVKVTGILFGLATVAAVERIARNLTGSTLVAGVAASFTALEPRLLFSSLSGMETSLLVALWAWIVVFLLEARPLLLLVLLSLVPVTRPEGIVLLPIALLGMPILVRSRHPRWLKVAGCCIPLLPLGLWALFCLSTNGHLLPNTFYLKAKPFELGQRELQAGWGAVTQHGFASLWAGLPGMAFFIVFLCARRSRVAAKAALVLIAAPLVYALGVVGTRVIALEGYYWTRWVDPASLLLTVSFCIGYGLAFAAAVYPRALVSGRLAGAWKRPVQVAGWLAIVLLVVCIPAFCRTFADRRSHLATDSRAIAIMNVQMGKWIAEHTSPDAVVGVIDAGAIRYFGNRRTIDFIGLNNADIAFGRLSIREAITKADWLVIFPEVFKPSGMLREIVCNFEARTWFRIPLEEYTICRSPEQTLTVAFQRKSTTIHPVTSFGS